jgi:predicted kinase
MARIQQLVQEGHPEVIQSTLHASLERDDALKMAEQTVLDAILVLQD